MRKLYIGAFGSGLGHAIRMLLVARAAKELGWDVTFSSSGEAADHLDAEGFRCNRIPYVDVVYNKSGSFTAKETAKYFFPILSRFVQQVAYEARNIRAFSPDLVISDSAMATVIAARLLGTRTVTVLNQIRLESSPKTPQIFGKLLSSGSVAFGDELWGLSERVLISDLPPPYTISERSIWSGGKILKKSEYIGFLSPKEELASDGVTERLARESGLKVFWQISGPPQTRGPLLAKALKLAESLEARGVTTVISSGTPGGETVPRQIPGGFIYGWCNVKDTLIKLADVTVSRAGHSSISQFILRRKPSILIPITSQSEQEGNARKATSIGIAVCLRESELDQPAFERALDDAKSEAVTSNIAQVSEIAGRFDPLSSFTRLLQ